MRIAVFIATTGGPVRVERITRERAPQSMVCLKRSSTVLPISPAYDSFVRRGSGVIERVFGPFEEGAFRLDVAAPIETGESWQLGFFVAHALSKAGNTALAGSDTKPDAILWLTGHVDYDLAVGSVGHMAEKVHTSRDAMAAWVADGRPVTMFVHEGPDRDAAAAAGVPDGVRIVPIRAAPDVLRTLGLSVPTAARDGPPGENQQKRRRNLIAGGIFAGCAAAAVAIAAAPQWPWLPRQEAHVAAVPPVIVTPEQPKAQPVQPVAEPVKDIPAAIVTTPPPKPVASPKLAVFERRAPTGANCAQVQFGAVKALNVPVARAGPQPSSSTIDGLCGLALVVDHGAQRRYVSVDIAVLSGKLLSGTVRPERFNGQAAFDGKREWPIDLPRRLSEPFEIRVFAVGGTRSVQRDATWLKGQADEAEAIANLSTMGFETAIVHHRVTP